MDGWCTINSHVSSALTLAQVIKPFESIIFTLKRIYVAFSLGSDAILGSNYLVSKRRLRMKPFAQSLGSVLTVTCTKNTSTMVSVDLTG
jgi:hypothetical protein